MAHSSKQAAKVKPEKPHPDFPLFPHASGRWAKKVRGKFCYFGPWGDPQGALEKWLDEKDDLLAGRTPRPKADGIEVRDLVNRFLTSKKLMMESKEITERTFQDYFRTSQNVIDAFGKNRIVEDLSAEDFEQLRASLSKRMGVVTLGNEINRIRVLFKYGYDSHMLDKPVRFGTGFKKPSRKLVRKARRERGSRMYEPIELRQMIENANCPLKSMILLALNCGFGQSDIANLPHSALDFESGWVDFPRPKTEVERRCHLWPETIEALKEAIENRPKPKSSEDKDLVFITKMGKRWVRVSNTEKRAWTDSVGLQFGKLLRDQELKRDKMNFYSLRHIFRTVADESKDQPAINHIMGHTDNSMAAVYRERISDERLKAVTDYVHKWLFSNNNAASPQK